MKSNILVAVSFILSIGDVFPGNGHFLIVHACHKLGVKLKPGVTPPGKNWRPRMGPFHNIEPCPLGNREGGPCFQLTCLSMAWAFGPGSGGKEADRLLRWLFPETDLEPVLELVRSRLLDDRDC
ncbi:uncharacterized protein LOC144097664 [Amblyomma americanum]